MKSHSRVLTENLGWSRCRVGASVLFLAPDAPEGSRTILSSQEKFRGQVTGRGDFGVARAVVGAERELVLRNSRHAQAGMARVAVNASFATGLGRLDMAERTLGNGTELVARRYYGALLGPLGVRVLAEHVPGDVAPAYDKLFGDRTERERIYNAAFNAAGLDGISTGNLYERREDFLIQQREPDVPHTLVRLDFPPAALRPSSEVAIVL